MPGKKRPRRERTHNWQQIQQYTLWPEQKVYELLRPVVLFQEDAAERARETGAAERTLQRRANQFEQHGMISLFPKEPVQPAETSRSLPPDMRQLIIVRRMADFHFHQAASWEEMQQIHRKWVQDYNSQRHWAHEQRDDGCHSPAQVIGWHKGTMVPEETLNRILFATRYTRHLDRNGYIRFQDWRLYGERGLAHQPVTVWVYEGTLKLECQAVTLSKYRVELRDDRKHIQDVSNPRVAETVFRSPQLALFDLGPDEWLLYWKAPSYMPRRRRPPDAKMTQLVLFEMPTQEKAAGAETTSPLLRLMVAPRDTEQE